MLADLIDDLLSIRRQRSDLAAQDKELSSRAATLQAQIMQQMAEAGTFTASSAAGHRVTMKKTTVPAIVDWPEFYAYVAETQQFDLLQRRLSGPAFRDRWDNGVSIPGATSAEVWDVSLSASRS